jgi:hypothetical protein
MMWTVLMAMACGTKDAEPKPIDSASSGVESDDSASPSDTGAEPTDPPPMRECDAPQLAQVGEFTSLELHPEGSPLPAMVLGSCGWGLAVIDANEDGWPDLIPAGAWASTFALVNSEGVLSPSDEIKFDGGALPATNGLAVGDIDQDGLPDLVAVRSTGSRDLVYINHGGGVFKSVALPNSRFESQGATLFDADGDGDLDLFVSRHIDIYETNMTAMEAGTALGDPNGFYLNEDGVFEEGVVPGIVDAATFQAVPLDADVDGDLDLFLVNDFGAFIESSELLINEDGEFSRVEDCGCDGAKFGMGGAVADVDGNGFPDVHVSNFGATELLLGMDGSGFYNAALARGVDVGPDRVTGWGTTFVDVDMDGDPDLASAFGPVMVGIEGDWSDVVDHDVVAGLDDIPAQPNALWVNEDGAFTESAEEIGFGHIGISRAVVVADFNRDGLPDLATSGVDHNREQRVQIYASEGGCGPGVVVDFPTMSASDLGAKVEWSVAGTERVTWMIPTTTFSSSGSTLHLGLGRYLSADWVRITPVAGEPVEFANVPAGTVLDQRSYQ